MKNYDSKFNPFAGAGILGVTVPVAVYVIGFVTMLVWGMATLILLPFFVGGQLDEKAFYNITAIVGTVLQVFAIALLTMILSVFSKMRIYHILLSAAISSAVFFIVERFIPKIRWANFPETMVIFPALFKIYGINYERLTTAEFVDRNIYLITTLLLAAVCLLTVLITWAILQIAARKERHKDEL